MVKDNAVDTQRLQEENKILREKLAAQENASVEMTNALGGSIASEIKKIRQKGKAGANTLKVVEQHDHKNISLWTRDGKRIGPLHPDNAIQALNRFADVGVLLTSDQPTAEQIASYKQTAEYKAIEKKEEHRRAVKNRSRKSGQMEKLSAEIAKMSGITVEAVNRILAPHEVKGK